jgi:hypothetical protein
MQNGNEHTEKTALFIHLQGGNFAFHMLPEEVGKTKITFSKKDRMYHLHIITRGN